MFKLVDISVSIAGIKFKNPVLTAAGPMSRNGEILLEAAKNGAGGLVTKTVAPKPAIVPRPCMAIMNLNETVPKGFLNAEEWSDIPYEQWLEKEYEIAKKSGLPIIASLGHSAEAARMLGPLIEKKGVNAIELVTIYSGIDPSPVAEATKALKEVVSIPVFVKLSPNYFDIVAFAKAVEKAGADAITAVDSLGPCLAIDIETAKPVLGGKYGYGWLSGPALKPYALRCVADITRAVKIPVIGVGGIMSGKDAIEYIMVGAYAVEICTGAILKGPSIYGNVAKEIEEFLRKHGYDSLEDIRGLALKHLPEKPLRTKAIPPNVFQEKCTMCFICQRTCPYKAISIKKPPIDGKKVFIDIEKCYGCGLCVSVCPVRAIHWD